MVAQDPLLLSLETMKHILVARATGESADEAEYVRLRHVLMQSPIRRKLPRFIVTCRSLGEFWGFIKPKFATYVERRTFLADAFNPLMLELEAGPSPSDAGTSATIGRVSSAFVHEQWTKALDRRTTDPEGAITASRTLLESVCKHILDGYGHAYDNHSDLPALYRMVSEKLSLAPSQHVEKVFKQILGGCQTVVEGLGALRNRIGDAHGQGSKPVRAAPRHAELAVNLAATMATFLLATYEARSSATPSSPPEEGHQ